MSACEDKRLGRSRVACWHLLDPLHVVLWMTSCNPLQAEHHPILPASRLSSRVSCCSGCASGCHTANVCRFYALQVGYLLCSYSRMHGVVPSPGKTGGVLPTTRSMSSLSCALSASSTRGMIGPKGCVTVHMGYLQHAASAWRGLARWHTVRSTLWKTALSSPSPRDWNASLNSHHVQRSPLIATFRSTVTARHSCPSRQPHCC